MTYVLHISTEIGETLRPRIAPSDLAGAVYMPPNRPGWSRIAFASKAAAVKSSNAIVRAWRHYTQPGQRVMTGNTGRTAKRDYAAIRAGEVDAWHLYRRKARGPAYVGAIVVSRA